MLWNYKVCDNENAMKQCCFQNNYGVIACRKVCICAPIFTFFVDPLNEYLRGKFIPKKYHFFAILGAVSPHFYSHNGEIWHEGADLSLPVPSQIFFKLLKGVYPFWANLYQKLQILAIFAAVSPPFE